MRKTDGRVRENEDMAGLLVALDHVASVEHALRVAVALDL